MIADGRIRIGIIGGGQIKVILAAYASALAAYASADEGRTIALADLSAVSSNARE